MSNHDDWEEVWNARLQALEQVLGPCSQIYHAPIPLYLGGQADVVAFGEHLEGMVYVTAELTGNREAPCADYELMICDRGQEDTWGANVISGLEQILIRRDHNRLRRRSSDTLGW